MIAIPVDSATPGVKSSGLFGNVPMFAVYRPEEEDFYFVRNPGCGDGVATAEALSKWHVDEVVYSYMGDGPYKALDRAGVGIYFIGKEPMGLGAIVAGLNHGDFVKVDGSNADSYLDPGTASGNCGCGCSHD